ncbi:aspartyl-phosphate phosphatase Spo0E family protein [Gorillibacterium sp. CAU 1737]|uniref:aspartyl-phosphate phosphatase Spo0E family protein n=1 Tax=Gorillibacterium sp. CAU 1737 TaxID=3140362 RepID=UPI003261414F
MDGSIEEKRKEMHELAQKYGISDPRVLKKSRELDRLLNGFTRRLEPKIPLEREP